ncbi:hypothetical protein [Bosea sp. (in: a-proteobacteria)]|uniref:hypothetical protein n=1 Tax=Bosea sp. (in: a-proteobacteria) TaxID=1871050 RepID=UPI003B3A8864
MQAVFTMIGLPSLPLLSMILVTAILVLGGLLFGWICDLLLGQAAFGTVMNTIIMLIGAFAGAWLWHRFGVPTRFDPSVIKASVATASGLLLVLVLAMTVP